MLAALSFVAKIPVFCTRSHDGITATPYVVLSEKSVVSVEDMAVEIWGLIMCLHFYSA